MVVTRNGDSVRVRYIFTDRNRGTRVEMRYVIRGDSVLSMESRPILPDDRAGDPTIRVEIVGDSVRQWTAARTTVGKAERGTYYTLTFTPFDQARLAKHLLRQPNHTAKLSANSAAHLGDRHRELCRRPHGKEHVRWSRSPTTMEASAAPRRRPCGSTATTISSRPRSPGSSRRNRAPPALPTLRKSRWPSRRAGRGAQ